ncbi:MAG: hypothetical protein Q8N31_10740 [Reyranella sp.]|nr:hypothetical protein [Reyranella sp.]MDP3160484.1 hypothetical protein [Reyranella sp.]
MGIQIYPTVPVAQPAAEPWPVDEHTIRIDEMFARQLDTEFSVGLRGLLHHPETGVAAQSGEAALNAIAGALPALNELKERTLSQAMGPRQRSILEPLIETRLDWAAGTLGQLAQRATVEVDDQSVADRIAGLRQDASTAWRDPAYLQKLGRTTVEELRYQGERRGWDPTETDAKVRGGLSDFYAGAVEAAIGQDDLSGASGLYEHARPIIDPERQAVLDRRFVRAREVAVYRDVDRDLEGIPIEPAGPPDLTVFEDRAAELTPEDASDEVRAGIAQVADHAHRHAERQWNRQQAEAGVAAFDWVGKNPGRSVLAIPPEIRDWLAPDQWQGLEALLIEGRLRTDSDLFERLDWQMIYAPDAFAGADLDRRRLSLDDEDHARFAAAQKAIGEGRIEPDLARYDRMRRGIDRALEALNIDAHGPVAAKVRAHARDRLDGFEQIEGRPPNGADIAAIVSNGVSNREVAGLNDPNNLFPAVRLADEAVGEDLFHQVQDVGDNRRQGQAAEKSVVDEIKRIDPNAKIATQIRVHVEGGPKYMMADIVFSGNGNATIHILEVKSGDAKLTSSQVLALAEAAKTGNIYIVNSEAAEKLKIDARKTFGAQGILPQVTVVGGDQEAIRRQMIRAGLDVVSEGAGRGGRPQRLRFGARPI